MQANTVFAPPKRKRSADVVTEIPETPLNSYLEGSHNYNYNYSGELLAGEREREILVGKFRSMKLGAPGSNGTGAGEGMEESAVLFDGDDEVRDMEMDEAEEESNPTIRWKHDHGEQEKPTFNVVPPEDEDGDVAVQMPSPPREASDARGQGPGRGSHKRLRSPPPPVEPPSPEAEEETLSDVDQQGIAYIPTPEQRHARSQRRLQQIKEYKYRETREAREKRTAERRRRKSQSRADAAATLTAATTADAAAKKKKKKKKAVHFHL